MKKARASLSVRLKDAFYFLFVRKSEYGKGKGVYECIKLKDAFLF